MSRLSELCSYLKLQFYGFDITYSFSLIHIELFFNKKIAFVCISFSPVFMTKRITYPLGNMLTINNYTILIVSIVLKMTVILHT